MGRKLKDVMDGLEPNRRARIGARAEEIHQEYLTLKKLRSHMELTQTALACNIGVAQATVAQLEQRNDIHASILQKYVEALGGTLSIIADMPGQGPMPLTGLGDRRLASADHESHEELTTSRLAAARLPRTGGASSPRPCRGRLSAAFRTPAPRSGGCARG